MATATPRATPAASQSDRSPPRPADRARGTSTESLDTTIRLVTPERIVFLYPLAGPFRRVFAYLIDVCLLFLLVIVALVVSLLLSLGSLSGLGPALVAYFALVWGYGALCETVLNGQTPGKRALGIRVVSETGVPITGAQAVLRNLVGAVDGLIPFFYMLALASMLLTRRFQRLGDLAAGTMVVVEERQRQSGVIKIDEPDVKRLLPYLPLQIAAGPELARALSDYVTRRERFGPSLREEMAAPLARPLRARYGLPSEFRSDIVLCALYHRVFLGD
ncbi:MAG: RDD family protein [Isosphaeraceae bacterium]